MLASCAFHSQTTRFSSQVHRLGFDPISSPLAPRPSGPDSPATSRPGPCPALPCPASGLGCSFPRGWLRVGPAHQLVMSRKKAQPAGLSWKPRSRWNSEMSTSLSVVPRQLNFCMSSGSRSTSMPSMAGGGGGRTPSSLRPGLLPHGRPPRPGPGPTKGGPLLAGAARAAPRQAPGLSPPHGLRAPRRAETRRAAPLARSLSLASERSRSPPPTPPQRPPPLPPPPLFATQPPPPPHAPRPMRTRGGHSGPASSSPPMDRP